MFAGQVVDISMVDRPAGSVKNKPPLYREAQDRSGVEGAVSLIHEHVSGK